MKTRSVKKILVSMLLTILMLMSLVPMAAFAATVDDEGKVTSTTFDITSYTYGYGKRISQCVASGEIGIVWIYDRNVSECTAETFSGYADLAPTTDMYFAANKQYYMTIKFGAHDETGEFSPSFSTSNVVLNLDGVPCEQVDAQEVTEDGKPAYIVCYKLPMLDASAMAIPFTKVVEQGGDIAPLTGNFELEIANLEAGSNMPIENYDFSGLSFSTNGVETADKQFLLSGDSFDAVKNLLDEGILVREKASVDAGWENDDAVWCVKMHHDPDVNALDDDIPVMSGYTFDFFKGNMVDGEFVADSNEPANKMTFTNTYTEDIVTLRVPFVKKVTLGGDVAPARETFKFEIFDIGNSNEDDYEDVTYTAEVTINGEGEFEGDLVITGPQSQIDMLICEGFYVREIHGNAVNWTYSNDVWHIVPEWIEVEGDAIPIVPNPGAGPNIEAEPEFEQVLTIYPTSKVVDGDFTYYEDAAETAMKMIFENIYTETGATDTTSSEDTETVADTETASDTDTTDAETSGKPSAPQTGDGSNMVLWFALLLVFGFGIAATVIGKKISVR